MDGSHCTALLVVGHGTRSRQGLAEYWDLLALTARNLPDTSVEGCFLEMADPDITTAMQRLARRGARRAVVMPLLLFDAGHARRDIPREARQAAKRYGLQLLFASPLGNHPQMVELSARRFRDAIRQGDFDPRDVLWVFVGRSDRDPKTTRQFREFLADRQRITPVGDARGAFLAMTNPRIESLVDEISNYPLKWVVVQPHLLFAGELFERLQRIVHTQDQLYGRQQWLMADHLGCDQLVAAVVTDRFHQALANTEVQSEPQ